ncbi:hypothetical protein Tco_0057917 [Tanacetum coccineum]
MAKPILNETQAEQNLVEPRVECNVKFKFGMDLLTELQNNTFSGRCKEDVIGHIGKIHEILDLVKIAGVDPFQVCMKSFHLSISKDVRKRWMKEGDGDITTWEEFVMKIFKILYPLSCASNYDKMCDDDGEVRDPLEFIPFSSDKEWKEHEYKNPPNNSFPKPYVNINNEKDKNHHNENNGDDDKLSGMNLSGAPHSKKINNEQPNEGVCRVDKFEVIKYTIGDNEEFLAICIRECDFWAHTVNGVSSIYHDIFPKKDEGWTVHHTK